MRLPLIGITCGTGATDGKPPQDRLNRAYSHAIALAGGAPVILPNLAEGSESLLDRLDGILVSGGWDIDPNLYGQEILNDTLEIDEPRDRSELPIIREALRRDMPMLAICRGIQSLNVALGGTLYQDLP